MSCQYPNYEASSSKEIKELIEGMLVLQKESRMSLDEAIMHPFLHSFSQAYLTLNKRIALEALNHMKAIRIGYLF